VYIDREFMANNLHIISTGTTAVSPFRERSGNKRIHAITSYKQKMQAENRNK